MILVGIIQCNLLGMLYNSCAVLFSLFHHCLCGRILHCKSPRFLDDVRSTVLTLRIYILRIVGGDSGGMLMVRHGHQPNGLASSIGMLSYRER